LYRNIDIVLFLHGRNKRYEHAMPLLAQRLPRCCFESVFDQDEFVMKVLDRGVFDAGVGGGDVERTETTINTLFPKNIEEYRFTAAL